MNGRRQNMRPNPAAKHMVVYQDFSGGLNTVTSNDNLQDKELVDLTNIDLGERGSLKRRNGFKKVFTPPDGSEGKGQGYFRYYASDGTSEDIISVNGKLFNSSGEIPITGLSSFQTDRFIEAVQMDDKLIIATGTDLVEYDGTEAKVVQPYEPEPLEYMYVGSNGLADDPDSHIQDGESTSLRIDGVYPDKRYGVSNKETEFKVIISKPSTMDVEYSFNYREKGEDNWTTGVGYQDSNIFNLTLGSIGEYELQFLVRDVADTANEKEFYMPSFKVKENEEQEEVDTTTIKQCNRILLHWNRIILYGDPQNPQAIYVSDINNHAYFPIPNSLAFKNKRNEPLTDLIQFRNQLVAFTNTSIQSLFGKHPQEFQRFTINSDIGCDRSRTSKVMENYIAFLGKDGVYILKSVGTSETRANVEKIDQQIHDLVPYGEEAHAIVSDYQYQIFFPNQNMRFRYYYHLGTWTKDESQRFNFSDARSFNHNEMFVQDGETGELYVFEEGVWDDDGHVYTDRIETKLYDFGEPYNPKKLKELQLLFKHYKITVKNNIYVYADSAISVSPDTSHVNVTETGSVEWVTESNPNVELNSGTVFGSWEMGKSPFGFIDSSVSKLRVSGRCLRTQIVVEHEESTPNQLLGLGYIFKIKKP